MAVEPKCYKCKNLDAEKKSAGAASGNIYFCKKHKKYINPIDPGCDKFEESKRKKEENEEILKDGKEYSNDTNSVGFLVLVFVILVILGLILGVFRFD